jgi:hypothetical protein
VGWIAATLIAVTAFFGSVPAYAQITINNYQLTGNIVTTNTGTLSNFAVGSGSNRLLVVFVHESGVHSLGVKTVSSVTFGGVNLSHYSSADVSQSTESRTEVWYLVNPSVSTVNIVVTLSANTDAIMIGAVSLNGVDQSTPIASSQIYQVQSSQTSVPITWTTLYNNSLLLGSWTNRYSLSGTAAVSADSPETSVWDFVGSTPWYGRADGAYKTANAGSNTLSWTVSPSTYLVATGAGLEIKAAPPSAPVATAATNIQATSFSANWGASATATAYYLDVATDSGFSSFVTGYSNLNVGNVTTYSVDTNIPADTTYYYRVRAYNVAGTSGNSNIITLTTACAGPGVAVDTVTSGQGLAATITVSHTTSGTDRLMLVGISATQYTASAPAISTVTYNGVALSFVGTLNGGGSYGETVWIYQLVAPATGTFNVVASFSTAPSNGAVVAAVTFTGVNQSTPLGTFASAAGISGTTASVNASSASGELVFDTIAYWGCNSVTVGAGQTQQWNVNYCVPGHITGAGSTKPGAASVTMSWTLQYSSSWTIGAVPIKPAGCSVTPAPFLYRKPITISASMTASCSANLSNYPVLVSIANDANLKSVGNGGHVQNGNGYDIIFRATDPTICTDSGNPTPCTLDHEIEKYDGTTGTLVAWVRIPTLPHGSGDKNIYMYYDNAGVATPTANPTGVWNTSYGGASGT